MYIFYLVIVKIETYNNSDVSTDNFICIHHTYTDLYCFEGKV